MDSLDFDRLANFCSYEKLAKIQDDFFWTLKHDDLEFYNSVIKYFFCKKFRVFSKKIIVFY